MSILERCIESLTFCHLQDETRWPAARIIVRQDIDDFMHEAGPDLATKRRALAQLMTAFTSKFPDESDPVLIRGYMRRQMRRLGYDLQRHEGSAETTEMLAELQSSPSTAFSEEDCGAEAEMDESATQQGLDAPRKDG